MSGSGTVPPLPRKGSLQKGFCDSGPNAPGSMQRIQTNLACANLICPGQSFHKVTLRPDCPRQFDALRIRRRQAPGPADHHTLDITVRRHAQLLATEAGALSKRDVIFQHNPFNPETRHHRGDLFVRRECRPSAPQPRRSQADTGFAQVDVALTAFSPGRFRFLRPETAAGGLSPWSTIRYAGA